MSASELTRRNFVAGAAATAGLAAAASVAATARAEEAASEDAAEAGSWRDQPEPITDVASEEDYDLVIVGGGNGGMVAACTAAEAGAKVVVLEKYSFNAMAKEAIASVGAADQADCPVDMARLIKEADSCQAGAIDARLYRTWGEKSGEMMDWFTGVMEEHGVQVVLESATPDPSLDEHIYYPPICHNTFGNGFEYNPDGPNYGMYAHMDALVAHYTIGARYNAPAGVSGWFSAERGRSSREKGAAYAIHDRHALCSARVALHGRRVRHRHARPGKAREATEAQTEAGGPHAPRRVRPGSQPRP